MASQFPKVSLIFSRNGICQSLVKRSKSQFVYDVDKTASQKWMESRVAKIRENQKLHAADDGVPIWWKSTTDKVMTTFVFAATVASFVGTITNLIRFSQGKL